MPSCMEIKHIVTLSKNIVKWVYIVNKWKITKKTKKKQQKKNIEQERLFRNGKFNEPRGMDFCDRTMTCKLYIGIAFFFENSSNP